MSNESLSQTNDQITVKELYSRLINHPKLIQTARSLIRAYLMGDFVKAGQNQIDQNDKKMEIDLSTAERRTRMHSHLYEFAGLIPPVNGANISQKSNVLKMLTICGSMNLSDLPDGILNQINLLYTQLISIKDMIDEDCLILPSEFNNDEFRDRIGILVSFERVLDSIQAAIAQTNIPEVSDFQDMDTNLNVEDANRSVNNLAIPVIARADYENSISYICYSLQKKLAHASLLKAKKQLEKIHNPYAQSILKS